MTVSHLSCVNNVTAAVQSAVVAGQREGGDVCESNGGKRTSGKAGTISMQANCHAMECSGGLCMDAINNLWRITDL